MMNHTYQKIILRLLLSMLFVPYVMLLISQSIYAQSQDVGMLALTELERTSGPAWQLSINQNQASVSDQTISFSLPKQYEQVVQVEALVSDYGQIPLVITEDASYYQQQLCAYQAYQQEKNLYREELSVYQDMVERYQQAVNAYNEAILLYEQELAIYHEALLAHQEAEAAVEVVPEEELIDGEVPVTEAVPESISIEEPIAPIWDETVVDPSTVPEPVDPFDPSKERLWEVVLKESGSETYQLLVPKEVMNTVLLLTTQQVNERTHDYSAEAASSTTLEGAGMSYTASVLVEKDVVEPESSAAESSSDPEEDETGATSEIDSSSAESLSDDETVSEESLDDEEDEEVDKEDDADFSAYPLSGQTYQIELFNHIEIEQNASVDYAAVVKNLDELLQAGYSLEWQEEVDTSVLGEQTGELIVIHPDGSLDKFEVNIDIIALEEEAVPLTSNRMMMPMAARSPMNVNDLVQVDNLDLKSSTVRNGNPNEVWLTSGDSVFLSGSYQVDNQVQAGDYFTVELGSIVRLGGLIVPETGPTLFAVNGNVLATGAYDVATNTIRYTFTDLVDRFTNISGNFNFKLTQKREAHTFDQQPVQVAITFAGEKHEETMVFDYRRNANTLTQLTTTSIDSKSGTYTSVAYINQMQRSFNTDSYVTLSPSNFNFERVQIYRVPTNYVLPDNFMPDYSKLISISTVTPTRFSNGDLRYSMNPNSSMTMRYGERYVIVMTHKVQNSSFEAGLTVRTYGGSTRYGMSYQQSSSVYYTTTQSSSDGSGTVPMSIRKLDEHGSLLLRAAEFTLYSQVNGRVGQPIQTLSTLGGEAIFNSLEPGKTYYLFETKAPSGYQKTNTGFKIQIVANPNKQNKELEFLLDEMVINADGTYTQVRSSAYNWQPLSYQFEFVNQAYTTSLEFTKQQKGTDLPLEGAVFRLTKADDASFSQEVVTSNDGRVIFEDLKVGSYLLEEIEAPEGHALPQQVMTFEVLANTDNTGVIIGNEQNAFSFIEEVNGQNVVYNEPLTGEVSFIKMDGAKADDETNRLGGAEFKVTSVALTSTGEPVFQQTFTTNEQGEFTLVELPLGRYRLKEIKAPSGYLLLDDPFEFELTFDELSGDVELNITKGKQHFVTTDNSTVKVKNYLPAEFPETGGIGSLIFTLVGLSLMTLATILYWRDQQEFKGGD